MADKSFEHECLRCGATAWSAFMDDDQLDCPNEEDGGAEHAMYATGRTIPSVTLVDDED